MKFDKHHKVDIKKLNIIEAEVYLGFLFKESHRHCETYTRCNAEAKLWESEALRQNEDLDGIEETVREVRELFKL